MRLLQLCLFDAWQVRYDRAIIAYYFAICHPANFDYSFDPVATIMNQFEPNFLGARRLNCMLHCASLALMATVALLTSACVYHAPIQQGNLLDAKDIDQIAVGMTQAQVRYVLGTPMVADPFSSNRWDYVYYVKTSRMPEPKKQQLVVYFENGNVSRLERTALSVVKPEIELEKTKAPWYRRWLSWIV